MRYEFNSRDYIVRQLLNEQVIVPLSGELLEMDQMLVLNATAAAVISATQSETEICTFERIVELLRNVHENVDKRQVQSDAKKFIDECVANGIILEHT